MLSDADVKRIEELFDRKLEGLANMIVYKLRAFENAKLDAQFMASLSPEELKKKLKAQWDTEK